MEKVNQRVMLSKRLLKESFIQLLQTKDIHKICIRELCREAGINHCTFYKYYGSQYDLLREMENDMLQKVECTLAGESEGDRLLILLNYVQDNLKTMRLLIDNNIDPTFSEKLFSLSFVQREFKDILGEGDGKGEYVSHFIFYGALRIVQLWLNKEEREPPEEMAQLLTHLFLIPCAGARKKGRKQ